MNKQPILLPIPREMQVGAEVLTLPHEGYIRINRNLQGEVTLILPTLQANRINWQVTTYGAGDLTLIEETVNDHVQAYQLVIDGEGIRITGARAGLFYGLATLRQLIMQYGRHLPYLTIQDRPDYDVRGVMLDISRDKVPTMTTLKRLIDLFASLKINQLQIYIEHTFAYRDHRIVWELADPLTPADLMTLDAYCQARHIDLVPNQNSLGHMERWLKHADYNALAECPDGFLTATGDHREATTVDPQDPRSFELITSLYDEFLPNFSSELFNVGCDEPWELGKGKSKDAIAERGGRVYLDWVKKLHGDVSQRGYRMQFWGDIIIHSPELVPELPEDIILMEWGYESTHPFDEHGKLFADSGRDFYVCPGTSSWNTLIGRTDNAIGNMLNAARAGLKNGAIGFLNTDWGDNGHWQPISVSFLPFAYGAAVSWGVEQNAEIDIATATSTLVFEDTSGKLGQIAFDLGNIYKRIGPEHINGQVLAYVLQSHHEDLDRQLRGIEKWGRGAADVSAEAINQAIGQIGALASQLSTTSPQCSDGALILQDLQQAAQVAQFGGEYLLYRTGQRSADGLNQQLDRLIMGQRDMWLARNRRGGLEDSMRRFEKLRV